MMTFVMKGPWAGCSAYHGSGSTKTLHCPSCVDCWSSLPRAGCIMMMLMMVVDMMMVMMQHALENLNVQGYTGWFL